MSLFDAFVGGAADQATGILDRQMKEEADLERQKQLTQFQADLAEAKMRTTLAIQQEFMDAPLKRLGSKAQEFAGQDVPVDAPAPVTKVGGILASGAPTKETVKSDGYSGGDRNEANTESLRIMQSELDRMGPDHADAPAVRREMERLLTQSGIQPPQSQDTTPTKTPSDDGRSEATTTTTRKRTSDEALQTALDWAKVNDTIAYAEYQSRIKKPERDDRRLDIAEERMRSQDDFTRGRLERLDRLEEIRHQESQARLKRLDGSQDKAAEKAELQSTRQAITSVLKDIATQEDKIQMKLMDPMLSPEQRTVLEGQFKALDASRTQARAELLKLAGVEPTTAKQSPPPDGTRGIVDGVVGTVINGKFVPDVKETKGKNTTKTRDPNIPTFSTFEKEMPASQAELVAAQNAVEEAKSRMESNRNAMTINAYNQAVTNLTALNHRGK